MQSVSSRVPSVGNSTTLQNRCCGHKRSSSLPTGPINVSQEEATTKPSEDQSRVDLTGLVDTFNQISDSLSRPAKILLELLDLKNKNFDASNKSDDVEDASNGHCLEERVQTALKQISTIQGNLKHVLPHMAEILSDYKTIKERTQSRDEMLKTMDKALRRSEARSRAVVSELQDLRDENKCLKEKAQQNESILRYLNMGKDDAANKKQNGLKDDRGSKRVTRGKGGVRIKKKSHSVGELESPRNDNFVEKIKDYSEETTDSRAKTLGVEVTVRDKELGAKLEHYQKVLSDYENQLQEVVQLNKELVLKINDREAEVMTLNSELAKHQETLEIYERGFKDLTKGNSEMDAILRAEKAKNIKLSERLDDTEGYISCITDKVASYEVELKYLRQQLSLRDAKTN